jgi:hypothetical protein
MFNDACRKFIDTFTKRLKKAGKDETEVQRLIGLTPIKPFSRRKVSVNLSLGNTGDIPPASCDGVLPAGAEDSAQANRQPSQSASPF